MMFLVASCTVKAGGLPGILAIALSDRSMAIAKCKKAGLEISGVDVNDHAKCLAFLKKRNFPPPSWFRVVTVYK